MKTFEGGLFGENRKMILLNNVTVPKIVKGGLMQIMETFEGRSFGAMQNFGKNLIVPKKI